MRNDRRTPLELQELIERKVKLKLSSWEKRNIKEQYQERFNSKFQENCGSCWTNAIKELSRLDNGKKNKPALVKEKMIVHEKPIIEEHDYEKEVEKVVSKNEKDNLREQLLNMANNLAEAKGIKKPHSKTGIEKLEKFIEENK